MLISTKGNPSLRKDKLTESTEDDACMELARTWIRKCAESDDHQACRSATLTTPFLPKRLIYVDQENGPNNVHLHETSPDDGRLEYFALSHCWGPADFLKLTTKNYDDMLRGINFDELPRNFQHAINFTRRMKSSYLWIDSLCIVQDSIQDWKEESKAMAKIYSQAFCTISSTGSPDAHGGCFHKRNPVQYQPCVLVSSPTDNLSVQMGSPNPFISQIENGPLYQRAWAFQERLLSRRIVHFGSSLLFFECRTHCTSEILDTEVIEGSQILSVDGRCFDLRDVRDLESLSRPDIVTYEIFDGPYGREDLVTSTITNVKYLPAHIRDALFQSPVVNNRTAFSLLQQSSRGFHLNHRQKLRLHQCWFQLVEAYTNAKLTVPSDRTVAMDGIAQAIKGGEDQLEYLAGLWSDHIYFDLLWCLDSSPAPRPTHTRAPTWSWMAVEGKICQRLAAFTFTNEQSRYNIETMARLCDVSTKPMTIPINGAAAVAYDGHLDLEGFVMLADKSDLRQSHGKYHLKIESTEGRVDATIAPDIADFQSDNSGNQNLFLIEILRMARSEHEPRAYGLVLQKIPCSQTLGSQCDTYERIGSFEFNVRPTFGVKNSAGYGTITTDPRRRIRIV
ncbi:hypothetical protein FOBRF1_007095 [Fusarium oxysporum]